MNSVGSAATTRTPMQKALINRLEHELVVPCCFSQVVADHMSSEAAEMRHEIVQLVLSGRTEKQILDGYVAHYGRAILATPDGITGNIAFTIPPLIGVLCLALGGSTASAMDSCKAQPSPGDCANDVCITRDPRANTSRGEPTVISNERHR